MKKLLWFTVCLVLLMGVCAHELTQPMSVNILELQIDANESRLKEDVLALSNIDGARMFANQKGLAEASKYVFNEFEKLDVTVRRQAYLAEGDTVENIIAQYGNSEGKQLIIGAHYDVCGEQAGADDNASGIAGLLELARMLDSLKPLLTYGIQLVAYTLEEPPFFRTEQMGSYVHAKSLKDNGTEVLGMVCLEMIGYFSDKKGSQDYPIGILKLFYPNKANFIAVVSNSSNRKMVRKIKRSMKGTGKIPVRSITAPSFVTGIDFSDHLNYWKFDFPAVMITNTAFYRNKNYHEHTDTPETLDYNRMAKVVESVYWSVTGY